MTHQIPQDGEHLASAKVFPSQKVQSAIQGTPTGVFFLPPEDRIQVHLNLKMSKHLCWKHFMDVEVRVGGPSDRACQVFTVTP